MVTRSTLVALALVSVATVANAATIGSVNGTVSVSRGNGGFQPGGPGTVLNSGDRVSVAPGGSAVIACGPQSLISVSGGQTVTISDACVAAGLQMGSPYTPGTQQLAPEVVGGALIVGGAAAIGIAAAASGGSGGTTILPPVSP